MADFNLVVGVASELCTSYTPRNLELATFRQHQDPASPNSHTNNKGVVLELARQIAFVGGMSLPPHLSRLLFIPKIGDPIDAINSGTFAPGDLNSQNAAGNSCNADDCIFDNDLLVRDASPAEIMDYVADCVETGSVPTSFACSSFLTLFFSDRDNRWKHKAWLYLLLLRFDIDQIFAVPRPGQIP